MGQDSKIEWTKHTANIWWGCKEVHAGCDNCYAKTLSNRWGYDVWGNDKPRRLVKSVWKDLEKFQRIAEESGERHRVFINSMSDLFEKPMPVIDHERVVIPTITTDTIRKKLFEQIDDGMYNNLILLLLTKRPSNIHKYIPESWLTDPPENVMFGTSVSDQKTFDDLVPKLLKVNGKHFLSIEPMLGPINLTGNVYYSETTHDSFDGKKLERYTLDEPEFNKLTVDDDKTGIDWVICGGESGPAKRPFNCDWARSLRDQCASAGVPFFMKQVDKVRPIPDDLMIREFPKYHTA